MGSLETLYVILVHLMDDSGHTRITQDEKNLLSNLIMSHSLLLSSLFAVMYTFKMNFYYFIKVCVHLSILHFFFLRKSAQILLCCVSWNQVWCHPHSSCCSWVICCPLQGQIFDIHLFIAAATANFRFFLDYSIFLNFWMWFWMSSIHIMISQHFKISKK